MALAVRMAQHLAPNRDVRTSRERSLVTRVREYLPGPLTPLVQVPYRHLTGRGSRRLVEWRLRQRMRDPQTFNEKIHYKMAFDRRPILTTFADKISVRDYVSMTIGPQYLSTALAIAHDVADVPWSALPQEYVCKVNHASGGIVLAWADADPTVELPASATGIGWEHFTVHPDRADPERISRLCRHWLAQDYAWHPGMTVIEWAYQDIKRGVLIEELLRDQSGRLPKDYKFYTFNGKVRIIQVDTDRFGHATKDMLTTDWERIDVDWCRVPHSPVLPTPPPNLELMMQAAEALSGGIDFVRADFYDLGSRVVFGELTNYPACGFGHIAPHSMNLDWGRMWRLDS